MFDRIIPPNKVHFKIGEVARIAGVKPHVLRYWESEFSEIHPAKSGTNQRIYARRDVEFVLLIKDLLHVQGYTIAGARRALAQTRSPSQHAQLPLDIIRRLKAEVAEIIDLTCLDE